MRGAQIASGARGAVVACAAMTARKRVRTVDWLVSAVIFLLGLFFLSVGEFGRRYGTTPESQLIVVSGPADSATRSRGSGTDYLRFRVSGYAVDYSSDQRGFGRVLQAIEQGEALTIGLSTKRETLFRRSGWFPLYTLSVGGQQLWTYQDTVTHGYRGSNAPFILAAFLLALGGWALISCYRQRGQLARELSAQQIAAHWNDPRRIRAAAILISVLFYIALLSAVLHPDSTATFLAAFGERPLGLPVRLFVVLLSTLCFVPTPVAALHLYRLVFRAAGQGGGLGKTDILRAVFVTGSTEVDLRTSQRIVVGIGLFYLLLLIAWIGYASYRGI